MEIIKSSNNQYVKLLRSLGEKKHRKALGLYVAEGKILVNSLDDYTKLHSVYVREDSIIDNQELLDKCNCAVHIVEKKLFNSTQETITPSGICGVIYTPYNEIDYSNKGKALILDRISDPGNLGTILRTAAALDYEDIYLINCVDAYSGKVVRASMGGIFSVRLYEVDYSQISKINKTKICLDMSGNSIYDVALDNDNYAIIVGNEAHGVAKELLGTSDLVVSLPMSDRIESLNASVACSIVMYLLGGLNNGWS